MSDHVAFNRAYTTGSEFAYIEDAIRNGHLSGNGPFSALCAAWLQERLSCPKALLTPSCTDALEMSAILCDIGPGDEVIMPSFTFVSTANAFALRGATPVFVDIREDTLNLDEQLIEDAITSRTRAVVAVHYAGVGCEMDAISEISRKHGLIVIEDAAQGILATYRGRPLGSIGELSALSFHETKNLQCGEGGALVVSRPDLFARADVVQEKGTNRREYFRGQVAKYSWVDVGSSFLLSEINAAFLWAQLERAHEILQLRMSIWRRYHEAFADLESQGRVRRPSIPTHCEHNAHTYYLLLDGLDDRSAFIANLAKANINAVFHYVPLHESAAGVRLGRGYGSLKRTVIQSERLVRLPLWAGMTEEQVERVIEASRAALAFHP